MTTVKINTIEDYIIRSTDWTPYAEMPMGNTKAVRAMKEDFELDGAGVYQVALKSEIPIDNIIDKNIGYTGRGTDVFRRAAGIRTGRHDCGKMLKLQNISVDDIVIRFLFTKPDDCFKLEQLIHKMTRKEFQCPYKWSKASGGLSGIITRVLSDLEKLTEAPELAQVAKRADELLSGMLLDAAKNGTLIDIAKDFAADEDE